MTFYTEWHDFVTYAYDPDRVQTGAQRLDVSGAMDYDSVAANHEKSKTTGVRIPYSHVVKEGDEFEAMRVNDYGQVIIWTKRRVWCLQRQPNGIEKLIYLPRHPFTDEIV